MKIILMILTSFLFLFANAETINARITETYIPEGSLKKPMITNMASAREECEYVFRNCCDQLFKQTGIDPTKDIDVIICNCSLFNPTPSISAMVMNAYKFKTNLHTFLIFIYTF